MKFHIIAFFTGFILDLILGDPYWLFHPIRLIGGLISGLEKKFLNYRSKEAAETDRDTAKELRRGAILVFLVVIITAITAAAILLGAYLIHPYLGAVIEAIMTYQILATKCLKVESMKVYKSLETEDIEASRKAVSMIVGRDTNVLDDEGVTKAAVETVAENTSDGIIAPMIYTALGGPILGFVYKAINTMDSMLGYKNDKYLYFGRAAAKLDDFVNYIPARISAYIMILAACMGGRDYSGKNAYRIYKRDNRNHASPNSAQTESACAGALGIQLAGDASYFGKIVKKPYIGDKTRKVEHEDIRRVNKLMYLTAGLCEVICLIIMLIVLLFKGVM